MKYGEKGVTQGDGSDVPSPNTGGRFLCVKAGMTQTEGRFVCCEGSIIYPMGIPLRKIGQTGRRFMYKKLPVGSTDGE